MSPIARALAVGMAVFAPAIAGNLQRHFESPITESVWRTAGNPLACRLSHDIPDYGRAVFTRHAGGALDFHFDLNHPPGTSGSARIEVVPPPWKHDAQPRQLGTVDFADRAAPFTLQGPVAGVLLASLEEGMFARFSYATDSPVTDSVSVSLSAVNFLDSLDAFQRCANDLMDSDFSGIRQSRILFGPGATALDQEARQRLDRIATWMKLDQGIAGAVIEGHADASGQRRQNYLLSQRRAQAVRKYLAEKGIASQRMKVRFYGEERPLSGGAGDVPARQNRRVEVTLYR